MARRSSVEQEATVELRGAYGEGNFGDDALMVVAYGVIKKVLPQRSVALRCKNVEYVRRLLPEACILTEVDRGHNEKFDTIVYGGGTQWYAFPQSISLLNRIQRSARRRLALARNTAGRIVKTPQPARLQRSFALGVGAGPFSRNSSALRRAERIFTSMQYVAVRDTYSYNLCSRWVGNRVRLRADLCYSPGYFTMPATPPARRAADGIRRIGVIVRDWPHTEEGDAYATPLLRAVDALRASGKTVDFISFAKQSDARWHERLLERKETSIEVWDPHQQTIPQFLQVLSRYDALISARYHGAVFASILGVPVVCVEVEQKLRFIAELLGGGSRLWSYPFRSEEIIDSIRDLESSYYSAIASLASVVQEQGSLARTMVTEFCASIHSAEPVVGTSPHHPT